MRTHWEQTALRQIEEIRRQRGEWLRLEEFAELCGIRSTVLRRLADLELIHPQESAETDLLVAVEELLQVSRMSRLHSDLGISWTSMPLVLDLLERVHELERELQQRGG